MTIQELYDWAMSKGVEYCDLVVKNLDGLQSHNLEPVIITSHNLDGEEDYEVELKLNCN